LLIIAILSIVTVLSNLKKNELGYDFDFDGM
jgi:hypothetical protein